MLFNCDLKKKKKGETRKKKEQNPTPHYDLK